MAMKKTTKELQVEAKNDEDWDGLMQQKGLTVVDAYSNWCGPCKAMTSVFFKIRITMECDNLFFATAETDTIEALANYRGKSEPTFLFYGDGQLVHVLRGCNGPMMKKLIVSLLTKESKIAEGIIDREIFVDKLVSKSPEPQEEKQDDTKDTDIAITHSTVAVIKPDAVQAGLVEEICDETVNCGFIVVEKVERLLTNADIAQLLWNEEYGEDDKGFDQIVEFLTSQPCVALAVSKGGDPISKDEIVSEFMTCVGPVDVNTAKEEAPESLRAKFGTDTIHNAIYCSISAECAARELAFFFPNLEVHTSANENEACEAAMERTIALIRPNAMARKNSVIREIENAGFLITMQKEIEFSREMAEEFYCDHKDEEFYETLITTMSTGSSLALCLEKGNAVEEWSKMLVQKETVETADDGEEVHVDPSLQVKFASDGDNSCQPLHGSRSLAESEQEMNFLFSMQNAILIIKPGIVSDITEDIISRVKQTGLNVVAETEITMSVEQVSLLYGENAAESYFNELVEYVTSGPSLFFILSGYDAINILQSVLGPAQPEEAKECTPDSIRGKYGEDVVHNVAYGSTSKRTTVEIIECFFPNISLDASGLVVVPRSDEKSKDENEHIVEEPLQPENNESLDAGDEVDDGKPPSVSHESPTNEQTSDKNVEESATAVADDPTLLGEHGAETEVSHESTLDVNTDEASHVLALDGDGDVDVDAGTSSEPIVDGDIDTGTSHEPIVDGDIDTDTNHELIVDGNIDTDTSHEPIVDDNADTEVSQEPQVDGDITTEVTDGDVDAAASLEPTLDVNTDTDTTPETTLDVDVDVKVSHEPQLDGDIETGASRESTLVGNSETEAEPTLDVDAGTEVSRESTLLDNTDTEVSQEPTSDVNADTEVTHESTFDSMNSTEVSRENTVDETNTELSTTDSSSDKGTAE